MGDVAMTAPIVKELSKQYPKHKIIFVSRAFFKPFFLGIENLEFIALDPKGTHKGFWGLLKLFFALRKFQVSAVADLHNNLRSRIIGLLFSLTGVKVEVLSKDRAQKKALTAKQNKVFIPLKTTLERYVAVFTKLNLPISLTNQLSADKAVLSSKIIALTGEKEMYKWIGISPFAQHEQKVYPLAKMEKVALQLAQNGYKIFVFGGNVEEESVAKNWENLHKNITSVVKKLNLIEELDLISQLDVMLSMDSAGMHLASLKGVPVVSIWGATHPYAGFMGFGQSIENAVQIDLACRPCSVYGNKICYRGDFACMNLISETAIIDKINLLVNA
ncbi:MAG: glycosyltransferase family 9 protein [Sphingobacteriaceae bacterium]|nr:glycosyltransferase family 9 protein [Sphingobacteriaceae bacterium]